MTGGSLLWDSSPVGTIGGSSVWSVALALRPIWLSRQGAHLHLLPFLPCFLSPNSNSKQRLSPERTILCLMIKETMGFLGSPLGPQSGGLLSMMPNKPGYFGASQQQNYRLKNKGLGPFLSPCNGHTLAEHISLQLCPNFRKTRNLKCQHNHPI